MNATVRRAGMFGLFAFLLAAAPASSAGRAPQALSSKTAQARTTPGTKLKLDARTVEVGEVIKVTGGRFKPGEYVIAWQYRGRKGTQLVGARAGRSGRVKLSVDTLTDEAAPGARKLCLQGERSGKVACARYQLRDTFADELEDADAVGETAADRPLAETVAPPGVQPTQPAVAPTPDAADETGAGEDDADGESPDDGSADDDSTADDSADDDSADDEA